MFRSIKFLFSAILAIASILFVATVFASLGEASQEKQFDTANLSSTGLMWKGQEVPDLSQIDYHLWDEILRKHVYHDDKTEINYIDYKGMTKVDKKELDYFIYHMQKIRIHGYSPKVQQAYWINLYNALTVRLFLKYPKMHNILDLKISKNFQRHGPWGAKLVKVHNTPLSLNDIEAKIIHTKWFETNMLYLLYYGAKGSPNLQAKAITPENLDDLLKIAPKEFVNRPNMIYFRDNADLTVSSFYLWHKEQFNDTDIGILSHLKRYANLDIKKRLNRYHGVMWFHFNWHLNDIGADKQHNNYITSPDQNRKPGKRVRRHEPGFDKSFCRYDKCNFHT